MILFYNLKKVGLSLFAKSLFLIALCLACLGQMTAQNVIYVDPDATDGDLIVYNGVTGFTYSTCKAAVAAASAGDTVRFLKNIEEAGTTSNPYGVCVAIVDRITIDGNGHSIKGTGMSGSYSSVFYFKGGTIKNFSKITGGFRTIFSGGNFTADLIIDNCVIDAGTGAYVFNTDAASHNYSVSISNCDIGGWFSYTGDFKSFTITDCTLGKGTSSYAFYRPYSPTVMQGCSFSDIYEVDPSENSILFNDCDIAGTPLTSDNLSNLLEDPSDWQNQANGSLSVVVNGGYSENAEGEITGGVYGGNPDVLEGMLAEGYAAIPLGTTPETYRVTPVYYIHFNAGGGTGTMEDAYVPQAAPDNQYTVPACTFTNGSFSFLTWNTKPAGAGTNVAVDATMTLTSDTTLYAVWDCEAMIGTTCYGTLTEAIAAAAIGDTVKMLKDVTVEGTSCPDAGSNTSVVVDRIVLDGQGHTLTGSNTTNVIFTKGGTFKDLNIRGGFKGIFMRGYNPPTNLNADVIIDGCTIDSVVYAFTVDGDKQQHHSLIVKNSTINSWTSFSDVFENVTITNCSFGAGIAYPGYSSYAHLRPYGSAVIDACSFSSGFTVSTTRGGIEGKVIIFNDCDIAGTPLTSNNFNNLLENHDQEASTQKGVVVNGGFSQNPAGEITGGIYGGNPASLKTMLADGYEAIPLGTDPETYRVTPVYYIHFNNNGGSGEMADDYVAQDASDYTVPASTFTNGEWSFGGWNTKADGTGDSYAPGSTITLTSDTTLYAQWQGVARIGTTQYLTLDAAAAAVPVGTPTTITILRNLNFYDAVGNLQYKTITFDGTPTDTLTLTDASHLQPAVYGADLTFSNITLLNPMGPDDQDRGIAHLNKLTINDCEVIGFMRGFAPTFICNNCTFTKTGKYHLWTYSSNCTFNNCTFNSYDNTNCKAINVYWNNVTDPYRVIMFNDCAFNSNVALADGNSAIQVNSASTCFVIYINNCTVSGYNNTTSTVTGYENLINNKEGSHRTTLYIDGVEILKQSDCDPVAMIGDTYYGTLQGALDAAYGMTGDVTVNLIKDCAEDVTVSQKGGLNTTIDGNNHTLNGRIFVDGKRLFPTTDPGEVVITNLNFTYNDALTYIDDTKGFICNSKTNLSYAAHVTVSNCTFDGGADGVSFGMTAYRDPAGAQSWDITLDHLVAKNCHSLVQATSVSGLKVTHCKAIDNVKNGINISGGGSGHIPGVTNVFTIVEDTLTCNSSGEYSLRLQELGYDATSINLSGNVFTATKSIITKNNNTGDTVNITLNVSGGLYKGILSQEGNDHTHFSFTGGTFTEDVATVNAKCAIGYGAFDDEGSSPQTCTVVKMNMLTFNANGGTGTMDTVYLDPRTPQTYDVPDCEYTYTGGIEFLEWNTKADGTGDGFDPTNGDAITGITSDTVLYAQWDCVAMIDDTPYGSIQAAVDAARASMTGDVTVKLLKDVTAYTLVRQKEGLDLTIDGQNHFLRGQIMIDGDGRSTGTDSLIIRNVKFEYDDGGFHASTPKAFVYFVKESGLIATSGHNYAHNVLVQNCSFDGLDRITYYPTYAVFSPNGQGGIYNITLDHLTATNVFTPALMNSTTNLTITHYTADEVTEGINIPGGTGDITLDYDTISAELYALRIRDNGTRVANIDNSQFVGANSILTGNSGTLNIAGGRYDGPLGYHSGYDADNDATVYSIIGGTFNEDVTAKCAEGYAAFANGTTPETWTVYPAYKVKYVANNGTDASDSIYVRQSEGTVVVKACDYTKDGYTFLKWNKEADGSGSNVAPGVAYPLTADVTFYAQWGLNLVYNVDQDIYYAALSTAMNEANPGDTLRLLENLDLTNSVEFTQEQTLDLHTKTLNSTAQYALKVTDGKVTFKNGNVTSNMTYALYCDGTAKLNVVDCNVSSTKSYAIANNGTDTVNILRGSVTCNLASASYYPIVQNKNAGNVTITDATITGSNNRYGVENYANGTLNLKGCTLSSLDQTVRGGSSGAGKIYVDDCNITSTGYAISNYYGSLYVNNSTITSSGSYGVNHSIKDNTTYEAPILDINNCEITAQKYGVYCSAPYNGTINIHGNTTITLNGTTNGLQAVYSRNRTTNIGGYINESDELVADGNVTISLTPQTAGTGQSTYNCGVAAYGGTVNIMGNTTITATGEYVSAGVWGRGAGKVNILGGTINVPDKIGVYNEDSDSIVIGKDDCTGPTITAKDAAIYNSAGHLIVKGGTLTATDGAAVAVSQRSTSYPTTLDIACGTLTGDYALNITNPNNFTSTNVKDSVYGGTFNGTVSETDDRIEGFITGGTFDGETELAALNSMCAPGYTAFANGTTPETWTVAKAYVLIYDANGGTGTMDTVVVQEANKVQPVQPCAFTFGTMPFINWNSKADGTGTPYTPVSSNIELVNPDTTVLYAQWDGVAKIGARSYPSLQAAVDAANASMTGDVTIDLVKNTSEIVTILQKDGISITVDGNDNTLTGQIFIGGRQETPAYVGTHTAPNTVTIDNLNMKYDPAYYNNYGSTDESGLIYFCKNCAFGNVLNYSHNVTISNCDFDADGSNKGVYAISSIAGSVFNLNIENCTAKNALGLATLQSAPEFEVTNCSTEDVTYGLRIVNNNGPMNITGNNFTADEAGFFVTGMTTGATINFANDTVNAPNAFQLASSCTSGNLEITSGLYMGNFDDNATSDFFNISGGTYSVDVTGEPCAEGYAAFANGTTPETWTVDKAWFLYYDKNEVEASGTMDTIFVRRSGDDAARTVSVASCEFTWLPYHTFDKWNNKAGGDGNDFAPGDNIVLSSDTTLFVIWKLGYTIIYHNNGGTGTIANQSKDPGVDIVLSDGTGFTKTDSTLYRWNTQADGLGTDYALGATYSDDANLDLYAVWRLNLDMTSTATDVVCYGQDNGTDTVKIIGGEAPYKLVLSGGALTDNVEVTTDQTQYVFTNLKPSANDYKVQLSDVLTKDTIRATFTIHQPDTLVITALTIPEGKHCPLMGTGHFDVSVTAQGGNVGGYHYTWSGDATNADNDATEVPALADDRDYKYVVDVTVTDSKACTATATDTIRIAPVIANDGSAHSNTTMTVAAINKQIIHGCDTIIRDFGTPTFVFTNADITEHILDTIYNNVSTVAPDSVFSVGTTTITWTAVDTCGHSVTATQDVVISFMPCPTAIDGNGNEYQTVRVGCYCWMAENLRATVYSDGSSRAIPNVMHYTVPTRAIDYNGNLYDWYAAMDAADGGTNSVSDIETAYAAGESVQGACPAGWHMPTEEEVANLMSSMSTEDLMAQSVWVPDHGTNASGFNMLPSGAYNSALDRYERKYVSAYFWILTPPTSVYHACEFGAACSTTELIPGSLTMGFSIRCVKDE